MRRCSAAATRRLLPLLRSEQQRLPPGGLGQRCRHATLADWQPPEVLGVLRQSSETGSLEAPLLQRLRGCETAGDQQPSEEAEAGPSEVQVACEWRDFLSAAELCRATKVRDFVLLAQLGDRLCTPEVQQAPTDELIRVGSAFAGLGVLHPPLFAALAEQFLAVWPADADDGNRPAAKQLVEVARIFSAQRYRHEELFGRLGNQVRALGAASLSPGEALSLLHSHAFLRLGGPSPEDGELGEELWQQLQEHVSSGAASVGPSGLVELCHVLFLARRVNEEPDLAIVQELLSKAAPDLLQASHSSWSEAPHGPVLHKRLLLLRSSLRYLHKETYKGLSADLQQLLRRVHRMESPDKELRPASMFTRKMSAVLTKLKIGNMLNAQRGPFKLDIVERDRKIIYECNHFDRFYTNSIEKIATMCLQERVVKAMGYKVVQVPHWQWNKIKHKKQRMEYVRMSRYYAIKDRRELLPRDDKPQDVAQSDIDFLGEYFFRKDMPLSSFSWFQPRYDYTKRLPPSNAAPGSL